MSRAAQPHSGAHAVITAADAISEHAEWRRKVAAALDIPADTLPDAAAAIARQRRGIP